ncbi:MAG: glycerophosphodiester phosphodiesterase family protein [Opitutales bacterium]
MKSLSKPFLHLRFTLAMSLLLVAATASGAPARQISERLQEVLQMDRPLVISHRGYKMAAPENTIPAFELGILAQADLIELDYFHSSDGVPVVFHDRTLDRTTDVRDLWGENISVTSRSMADLRKLDAGSWFSPTFAGVAIPTLEEALDAIQADSITLIERKHGDAATLIQLLQEKEMTGEVVVQAFDWNFLADCRALAPDLPLGALGPPSTRDGQRLTSEERFLNSGFLDEIEESGAEVVGWNRQVTAKSIKEAHDRGMKVWVYTINDLETAMQLLEIGVDGIISDNPPMVWKAIALHNLKPE